jgi:hypothetical protein
MAAGSLMLAWRFKTLIDPLMMAQRRATIGADTPIKTDHASDPLPRSGRSPTLF